MAGFKPLRSIDGSEPVTRKYRVNGELFIGDPVYKVTGSRIQKASAGTSAAEIAGVAVALYQNDANNNPKPLTFNQPTRGPMLTTTTSGWADVIINPDQTYLCEADTTASTGVIGQNIRGSAGTPVSAAGTSGWILDTSLAAVSASLPFQIVGIGPRSLDADGVDGPFGTSPILLEVKLNGGGVFNSTTGI